MPSRKALEKGKLLLQFISQENILKYIKKQIFKKILIKFRLIKHDLFYDF